MRSVRLILVLLIGGIALLLAAIVPSDVGSSGRSSAVASWALGLAGAVSLLVGLVLLRRGYLAAREAQGGGPLTASAKGLLGFAGTAALVAVVYIVWQISTQPAPVVRRDANGLTKADYLAREQAEIKRRQGDAGPAPAPMPSMPGDSAR